MSYRKVLLKVSGEMLMGDKAFGHDPDVVSQVALDVKAVHDVGVQVSIVIGGGNIYRGVSGLSGIERATSDYMGMLATVINALALQGMLESYGMSSRVLSAIPMHTVCEPYIRRKAIRHSEKGRVVIFAGGTGNPFFTTDTAAVLRAIEMNCDVILKGTSVDGVYSADPKTNKDAVKIQKLSYTKLLSEKLGVMDASAISLARDSRIPILVFSLKKKGSFAEVINGKSGHYSIIEGD